MSGGEWVVPKSDDAKGLETAVDPKSDDTNGTEGVAGGGTENVVRSRVRDAAGVLRASYEGLRLGKQRVLPPCGPEDRFPNGLPWCGAGVRARQIAAAGLRSRALEFDWERVVRAIVRGARATCRWEWVVRKMLRVGTVLQDSWYDEWWFF